MDLFSRKIIGWSLKKRLSKELIIGALDMALRKRNISSDLLLHSDRGKSVGQLLISATLAKIWHKMFDEQRR